MSEEYHSEAKKVAIVGAGVFGLSLAIALRERGHSITVFDHNAYDETGYQPLEDESKVSASVDHNKIFRASYGTKLHYQRLALESREAWLSIDRERGDNVPGLFSPSGMLRVQPGPTLSALEHETLANLDRDGLRHTQFVKSDVGDSNRACRLGWQGKLLDFRIPGDTSTYDAVLDSLAGFTRCSDACAHFQKKALDAGVNFMFGSTKGTFHRIIDEDRNGRTAAVGLRSKDGQDHLADVVVIAAGSSSTQLLPDLSYHIESSAGSIATFKISSKDRLLWDKYSPEKFPVITWKSQPRGSDGKDTGSVYVLPRTPDGLLKIGYRGIKFTNFQPAPGGTPFTQDGKWSIPLPASQNTALPQPAVDAIRHFVDIFLPEFKNEPFHSTKMCWYTDTLDNSFLIDFVPTYADKSVFVCTGGSGHGAKFMPVLGEHAADIFEHGDQCKSPLRPFWRWREDASRKNGLEDGPGSERNIGQR